MNPLRGFLVATLAVVLTAGVALAQDAFTLPQGAQLNAVMDNSLNTSNVNLGDRFSMHVIAPYPNDDQRFAGAIVTGSVLSVTRASRGIKPRLALGIDKLIFPDGTSVNLDAQVTSERTQDQQKNGAKVALSTLGGLLLGNAVGKTIFHTGGGGLVGAVGGFLYGYNDNANMTLPAGSQVQLTVARDIVIRRQSGQPV